MCRRCGGRHWFGGHGRGAGRRRRGLAGLVQATQVPPVWRAPEGPEGTGGLRDRPLRAKLACGDLAGGRARRRPEHQRHHKQQHATPQATKTPEPQQVPGSGGGGWGIRTPEGLHPTRFPSVRHRPLGESSVHIVPDNHKRKMSSRANPGQWSRSQARRFKEKGSRGCPRSAKTQTVGPANYANAARIDAPTAESTAPARGTPASSISRARACRCRRRCQ